MITGKSKFPAHAQLASVPVFTLRVVAVTSLVTSSSSDKVDMSWYVSSEFDFILSAP
jgi:hypothetical protein